MANYIEGNNFSGNKKGAIFNAGEGTKIINNEFIDQDKGIVNVGDNMLAEANTFKKTEQQISLWQKWWMKYLVYPIMVGLFLWWVTSI